MEILKCMWKGQRGGGMVYRYQVIQPNLILVQVFPTVPWDRDWKKSAHTMTLKEFNESFTCYENFLLFDDYPMADLNEHDITYPPPDFDVEKYNKDNNL